MPFSFLHFYIQSKSDAGENHIMVRFVLLIKVLLSTSWWSLLFPWLLLSVPNRLLETFSVFFKTLVPEILTHFQLHLPLHKVEAI